MRLDFYGLTNGQGRIEPDLEHEISREEVAHRLKEGEIILAKLWLRISDRVDLRNLDERIANALAPLGLK